MQKTSASTKNRIFSRLSAADMALLKPDLEPVELPLRYVLEEANKPIKHSYFIEYGLASIVAEVSVDRGRRVAHLHTLVPVKRLPWPKLPGKSRLHFLAYR